MTTTLHQTTDGTLIWVDPLGFVYSQQTNPGNDLTRQWFVASSEATPEDEDDCNTLVVDTLPRVEDYME